MDQKFLRFSIWIAFFSCVDAVFAQQQANETRISLADGACFLEAPQAWRSIQPRTRIVQYEFALPAVEGDTVDGRLTIMAAGGSIQANVDRWIGQFVQPDGSKSKNNAPVKQKEIAGQKVHFVDIAGTYQDRPGGPFGPVVARDGYRMLGAIIETTGNGNHFIKLYGPTKDDKCRRKAVSGIHRDPSGRAMKLQEFLKYHDIDRNPFAEEDAQTDPIFKECCIQNTYHPCWDKIFGNPADPSTSIVFGEKGSGKTALRLQVDRHLSAYNKQRPDARCYIVHYDDFNPFLDEFCQRLGRKGRRPEKALLEYRLWDHMDAILSLGVTQLIDSILTSQKHSAADSPELWVNPKSLRKLDRHQRRDLMLLAACYDCSSAAPSWERWKRLRRKLYFFSFKSWWPAWFGWLGVVAALAVLSYFLFDLGRWRWLPPFGERVPVANDGATDSGFGSVPRPLWWVAGGVVILSWLPYAWRKLRRLFLAKATVNKMRVLPPRSFKLARALMRFTKAQLSGQPLPNRDRTDDRYSLFRKFKAILETLGFCGVVVLVDRVDEPNLINGSPKLMRAFLWPMLDNKFLRQAGVGVKFMLPSELTEFIDREDRDFYQRARLDKQNLVPSLDWTGEALYDVANARLAACSLEGKNPKLRDLFDETITDQRLFDVLGNLRVPRHMFRFLHRVFVAHCNKHAEDRPSWKIASDTFESELALYDRALAAADRGLAVG